MFVLDTSAILAGIKPPPEDVVVPPGVVNEIRGSYVELAMYRVQEPTSESVKRVVEASRKSGDFEVLSDTDIQVLALALDMGATIITDDYAIQNVASILSIPFDTGEMRGIRERRKWKWRCESCGRYYRKHYESCPVCGGHLRRVRDK